MIEIKVENFYLGMWSAPFPGGDIFAMAWREPNGPWQLWYRFRYYKDDKTDETSQDDKHWYQLTAKDGSEASMQKLRDTFTGLLVAGKDLGVTESVTFVECMGDGNKMIEIMSNPERPWLRMRWEPTDPTKETP